MRRPPTSLLSLPTEVLEAVCSLLPSEDITSLASTARATASLHYTRIGALVSQQRYLTETSYAHLAAIVGVLPGCRARDQLAEMVELAMAEFLSKCFADESHLHRLQQLLSLASRCEDVPGPTPVAAAHDAAECCQSCRWQTAQLLNLCTRVRQICVLASMSPAHRACFSALSKDVVQPQPRAHLLEALPLHPPLHNESEAEQVLPGDAAPAEAHGATPQQQSRPSMKL